MNRWRWCRLAIEHRCVSDEEWALSGWQRWWYAIKACVCLLLNRRRAKAYGDSVVVAADNLRVGYHVEWGLMRIWDVMLVGHGLFRNWWYETDRFGYP